MSRLLFSSGNIRTGLLFLLICIFMTNGFIPAPSAYAATNTALLPSPAASQPFPNSPMRTTPFAIGIFCDLAITKTVTPSLAPSGSTVTIQFTVTDVGAAPCGTPGAPSNQTTVTDQLPQGLSAFPPASAPSGWNCSAGGSSVSCTTTNYFPVNQSVTITVQATVTAPSGTLNNCATVSSSMDQYSGNNQSCVSIPISTAPQCDLQITKTISPSPVASGSPVTITLTVKNVGQLTCGLGGTSPTTVTDTFPQGMIGSHATAPTGWNCTPSNPISSVTCMAPAPVTITPNTSVTISIQATVSGSPGATLNNCVTVSNPIDSNPLNDQSCAQVTIASTPPATATLCVDKFNDTNGNGLRDVGESELMQGWVFHFTDTSTGAVVSGTTDASGVVCVSVPAAPATITISEVQQPGWIQTSPNPPTITVSAGPGSTLNYEFGNHKQSAPPPMCDMAITKTITPNPLTLGQAAVVTLTVKNVGTASCTSASVYDPLVAGQSWEFPTSYGVTSNPAGWWICSVGSMSGVACGPSQHTFAPGDSSTLTFQLTALAAGNYTNCASVGATNEAATPSIQANNNSCVPFAAQSQPPPVCDLAVAKSMQPASGASGQTVTVAITVTNDGTGPCPAHSGMGILLADNQPSGMVGIGWITNPPGWGCGFQGTPPSFYCDMMPAMQPGDTASLSFKATVSGTTGTQLTNCAGVGNTIGGANSSNDNACAQFTITGAPPYCDMAVTKTMTPTTLQLGQTTTVTITVKNVGTGTCNGSSSVNDDTSPAGALSVIAAMSTGAMAPQATHTFGPFTVTAAGPSGSYTNCATVSNSNDNNPSNNKFCVPFTIQSAPHCDMAINKTMSPTLLTVGQTATVTLTVKNIGGGNCNDASNSAPLSVNDPISANGWAFSQVTNWGGLWQCNVVVPISCVSPYVLAPGASGTLSFQFSVSTAGSYVNCATVTDANDISPPNNPSNNKSCVPFNIIRPHFIAIQNSTVPIAACSLGITKTMVLNPIAINQTESVIITVKNNGFGTCNPQSDWGDFVVPQLSAATPITNAAGWGCMSSVLGPGNMFGYVGYTFVSCNNNSPLPSGYSATFAYVVTALGPPGTYPNCAASWGYSMGSNEGSSCVTFVIVATPQPTPKCIIATAAYGSDLAPPVQFLRSFRDNQVQRTVLGSMFLTAFNGWYYSWAPGVAQRIAPNEGYKAITRAVIAPLIGSLFVGNAVFTAIAPLNPEIAVLSTGLVASALIGLIYLTPICALAWKISRRKITRRTICGLAVAAVALTLIATLSTGTFSVPANLTALAVVETMLLTPALVLRKLLNTVGER